MIGRVIRNIKNCLREIYRRLPFRRLVFEVIRRNLRLSHKFYQHLYFTGQFEVKLSSDKSIFLHHFGASLENELFWSSLDGSSEGRALRVWQQLARQAHTILDIGANTGIYSLVARGSNSESSIFAFEPVKHIAERLKHNNQINNASIHVEVAAVSDHTGSMILYLPQTDHPYDASLERSKHPSDALLVEQNVPVLAIDEFCALNKITDVDLIKVDVELHEYHVLVGMRQIIARYRPFLIVEILRSQMGARIRALEFLKNYIYYYIDENIGLKEVDSLGCDPGNYLFAPIERSNELVPVASR